MQPRISVLIGAVRTRHRPHPLEPVGRRRIARDDDDLRGRVSFVPEDELRVAYNELPEELRLACGVVASVRHVRLVAEIDEILRRQVRDAVRPRPARRIVDMIDRQQTLEDGESADARIEDADRSASTGPLDRVTHMPQPSATRTAARRSRNLISDPSS